jgi:hypothetical protein
LPNSCFVVPIYNAQLLLANILRIPWNNTAILDLRSSEQLISPKAIPFLFLSCFCHCQKKGNKSCVCVAIKTGLCWSGRNISCSEERDLAVASRTCLEFCPCSALGLVGRENHKWKENKTSRHRRVWCRSTALTLRELLETKK